ncbi:cation diffusion facilitator family transporter [Actinopolyspora mzabensis]|uniref:Cation diffusion facilitator family transporter n=1 Tax=Actinopolyspora mzabensis TaxID=995066 RepID=A0A1G8W140_ACTMZ|nr:cation diffusion facilitator family transporter [Actinopolyspora mzabensis]SDJ72104.1 cation diffusion facilitator family transporter [Actinopolyspora mzabensis]
MSGNHSHGHGHGRRSDSSGEPRATRTAPARGLLHRLGHFLLPHEHDHAEQVDTELEGSRAGMRALWLSLLVLTATAVLQAGVLWFSGSVALLSDTLHNVADALTALPLAAAFLLARRPANRRFPYGYGRAEDVAGVLVVLVIAGSAVAALLESANRLFEPSGIGDPLIVALAGGLGFCGNELAARIRIRTGHRIGSAALVADGLHARTDSFTSLGVVLAAGGAALGWPLLDPLVGLLIGLAIAMVTWSAAKRILARLMDSVAPELTDLAYRALGTHPEVRSVEVVRLRWIGHALHAEVKLGVAAELSLYRAHEIAHEAERDLYRELPRLSGATVHAHPAELTAAESK